MDSLLLYHPIVRVCLHNLFECFTHIHTLALIRINHPIQIDFESSI